MTLTRDDLPSLVIPQRMVPDEFESEDVAVFLPPSQAVVPDFVLSHVHQYAARLLESRGGRTR